MKKKHQSKKKNNQAKKKNNQGFTLIELLVVMLILGLLAGLVGPRIFGHVDDAKVKNAKVQIKQLGTSLKMYKLDMGRYPTTDQGLNALVTSPESDDSSRWRKGGYLESSTVPKDPWHHDYIYLSPGAHGDFDITSYGDDGAAGGSDNAKDINSWELNQ
ncbi:MAG: type II secretion system major pseudopilin GspG [Desulfobacteraceae bacterium]|nr:type II secretion system major pseudopilin GspG [Desulfobacteraceae bacterium]